MSQNDNFSKPGELKIIFLGTPQFAAPILEKLAQGEYKPIAVFCAPDKPIGRQQILTPPPTKVLAQEYNILVFQPANSRELADVMKSLPCDIIITAAYGLILPKEILDAPQYGCLNIHPSLLPKYRGPSPIQSAILNGDDETGVTIYKMDEQIDHGPIIAKSKWLVANGRYTTPELSEKLANLSADLLLETLPKWITGKIMLIPQNDSAASYTKIIKKEDGQIDWQKSAKEIEQQIRAYSPWPGSFSKWPVANSEWQALKIIEATTTEKKYNKQTGEVFLIDANNLAVQTGGGALIIKKLQAESGKPLDASDFLRGHKEIIGRVLK